MYPHRNVNRINGSDHPAEGGTNNENEECGFEESKNSWVEVPVESCGTPISESVEQDARMPNNLGDAGRASLGIALRRTVQRFGVVRVRTRDSKPPPM